MKTCVSVCCLLVLTMSVETLAQQTAPPCEQKETSTQVQYDVKKKFAAVVLAVEGSCQVRENENATPQPIKSDTALKAGQSLQCKSGASLKIRFCNSKAEKEIKQNAPKWYVVPNVPAMHEPSGLVPALRRNTWYCDDGNCPLFSRYYYTDALALKEIELWKLYQKKAQALGESLSDDFYATYNGGQRISKQRFLKDMVKIDLKEFLWSDVNAEGHPDSSDRKLTYVAFVHLSKDGKKSSVWLEVTSNWVLRNGRWYVISHQQKNILDSEEGVVP